MKPLLPLRQDSGSDAYWIGGRSNAVRRLTVLSATIFAPVPLMRAERVRDEFDKQSGTGAQERCRVADGSPDRGAGRPCLATRSEAGQEIFRRTRNGIDGKEGESGARCLRQRPPSPGQEEGGRRATTRIPRAEAPTIIVLRELLLIRSGAPSLMRKIVEAFCTYTPHTSLIYL